MCDKRVRRRCRRPIRTSSERRETRKHIHHIHTCKERVNAAFSPRTRKIAYKYRYIDIHTHTNKHIYIYIPFECSVEDDGRRRDERTGEYANESASTKRDAARKVLLSHKVV